MINKRGNKHGENGCTGNHNKIFGVFYPTEWIVAKQHIANRAATNSGYAGDDNHAKNIHFLSAGGESAGDAFGGNADNI